MALPGALLPGNRAIERTEKMGIVSNGMLCSGDELRLSVDGEGILVLPTDTPVGMALTDLYGESGAGRGREAEPRRRPVPGRARARSRGGHRRHGAVPRGRPARGRPAGGRRSRGAGRGLRPVSALRRARRRRRSRGAVAGLRAASSARCGDAPGQQRRRRHELRHARAGQAHPCLRRRGRGARCQRASGHRGADCPRR